MVRRTVLTSACQTNYVQPPILDCGTSADLWTQHGHVQESPGCVCCICLCCVVCACARARVLELTKIRNSNIVGEYCYVDLQSLAKENLFL